jgi:peroxiredoxin
MVTFKKGGTASVFNLVDQDGRHVKLADFKEKKIPLYFYPKAGTSGCTKQACSARDARHDPKDLGVAVVGISPDARHPEEIRQEALLGVSSPVRPRSQGG